MSANLFPFFNAQFFDTGTVVINGVTVSGLAVPAAGYSLYQYASGTTTAQTTWSDPAGTIANADPIILDSTGRCTVFGGTSAYTFVLKTPGGATVKTWDNVSAMPVATGSSFLPLAGGTMTGPLVLASDATSTLQAVTLQQLNAAIANATAAVAASVATASAAAAAATAAAAAITPTHFEVSSATGSAVSRTVTLTAGTWSVRLDTFYTWNETANYNFTITQAATIGTTTVNTSSHIGRSGGSGFGREIHGHGMATGTLTVATTGSYTLAMAAASLSGTTSEGSTLIVEKTA